MHTDITAYNHSQTGDNQKICQILAKELEAGLEGATSKVWHGHPVWFLNENPIAGYSVLKDCVQLLFWSGQSFDEPGLEDEGTFKASQKRYTDPEQIDTKELAKWLKKSREIQWDYKNIVKRKGKLERIV